MAQRLYCSEGGILVGAAGSVPADPAEHAWPKAQVLVGCNRLRCERCGQAVVQQPGFAATAATARALAELHAAASWEPFAAGGAVVRQAESRLYLCGCTSHSERAWSPVVDDPEGRPGGPASWRCDGHPARAAMEEARALVHAGFGEGGEPAAVDRRWGVAEAAERAALGGAVLEQLTSPESARRMRALGFFLRNPAAPEAAQVAATVQARRELFEGVADPFGARPSVAAFALEVLAARLALRPPAADAEEVRQVVHAALVDGAEVLPRVFALLGTHDQPWLHEHAVTLVAAIASEHRTARAGAVAHALRGLGDDEFAALLAALAAVPGVHVRAFADELAEALGGLGAERVRSALG